MTSPNAKPTSPLDGCFHATRRHHHRQSLSLPPSPSLSVASSVIPRLIPRRHRSRRPPTRAAVVHPDRYIARARAFAFAARTMMKTSPRAVDPSRIDVARRRARRRDTCRTHPGRRHTRGWWDARGIGHHRSVSIDRYRSTDPSDRLVWRDFLGHWDGTSRMSERGNRMAKQYVLTSWYELVRAGTRLLVF